MEHALTVPQAIRRVVTLSFVILALLSVMAPARAATLEGDSTDYRLTFPVDGEHHFWDTFWASRSHGIHGAQDLMAAKGVPVLAAASGTISLVNWTAQSHLNRSRCCSLVLRHDDGWKSVYIHLDNDSPGTDDGKGWGIADGIVPGAKVSVGQVIAYVGDSGNAESTPSHLHFELYTPNGVVVNPFDALVRAGGNTSVPGGADALMSGSRILRNGERGSDVVRLQQLLKEIGHNAGPADGIFGPRTERAVRSYQATAQLASDGLVGVTTRGALAWDTSSANVILRQGSRGHMVRYLQTKLTAAGYDVGRPDGIFGPMTRAGVLSFQATTGLASDGLVGSRTRGALVS